MLRSVLSLLALAYLPGALVFRLPIADRAKRAALPAEERLFWNVLLSLVFSSVLCLSLAAVNLYRFDRLLWIVAIFCAALVLLARGRLRLAPSAPPPTWTALLPLGLVLLGLYLNSFVPPSEYIIGGRDPGIYMNEGIQIAQRGGLAIHDPVAAAVPAEYRNLFFPKSDDPSYYSNRFMGFFLLNPDSGTVVGQFPHLFPSWIALGYGVNGLTGARGVTALSAVLGLVAVYFAGVRLLGRAAAFAGTTLLALNIVQIWYARYPNAEIAMQPLVFAGLAAYARAQLDDNRFFAPVAALLFTLAVFAHLTAVLAIAGVAAAALVGRIDGRRLRWSLLVPLAAGTIVAVVYLVTILPPYFQVPLGFIRNLTAAHLVVVAALAAVAVVLLRGAGQPAFIAKARQWMPPALIAIVWVAASYAYFFRAAGGRLAPHDADALRTFTTFYLTPIGLAVALVGFAILTRRSIWSGGALLFTATIFSFFFFYKIRVVPEHFWAARRFLAVILPSSLLLAGAAAFTNVALPARWSSRLGERPIHYVRAAAGAVLVLALGIHYFSASRAILRHVEYAGLIPRLEQLADTFGDDDLVLVESRGASDTHVLALPLAYIYRRNVLVLARTNPNKRMFREFLSFARQRYRRIFFVGAGGTELLSRSIAVEPVRGERFQVPEYESEWNGYPRRVRFKEFDFAIYEFVPRPDTGDGFTLDVGTADDLYVRRFLAKERHPTGFTFRWTRDESYVSILGTTPDQRQLTLWLDSGGRPAAAGPADVQVFLNSTRLGAVTVGGYGPYRFTIPPKLAASMSQDEDAAQLRILSRTWNPAKVLGSPDTRDLGVMVDRIEIR